MKIIQYKSEYFTYTVDLLKKTKNIVKTSSNIFDSIARLFENAYTNETELNQLFLRRTPFLQLKAKFQSVLQAWIKMALSEFLQ